MERMNSLLEKYFRGDTSLSEEKELKHYFSGENVAAEHEIYRALFDVFELEKTETALSPLNKVIPKQRKVKQIRIKVFAYTGIAASLLLLLWVQIPKSNENYAVINGTRIDNPEYVQRYAQKKMNYVNDILKDGLKPLQRMNVVNQTLQPLNEIKETHDKMIEIEKTHNINN